MCIEFDVIMPDETLLSAGYTPHPKGITDHGYILNKKEGCRFHATLKLFSTIKLHYDFIDSEGNHRSGTEQHSGLRALLQKEKGRIIGITRQLARANNKYNHTLQ